MVDPRRRYLAIQRELGGNAVILSSRTDGPADSEDAGTRQPSAAAPIPAASATVTGRSTPTASPAPAPAPAAPRAADWRKGAPPIPSTAGISVTAPARGLLDQGPVWPSLAEVSAAIAACQACLLCRGRTNTVPGEGNPNADLMFIGEGPGQVEDETGRPFVGRAGELLTQIIEAVGLRRADVYIANAVKCRPPQNRKPLPEELAECRAFLERQIELVRPKVIVALGATAAETLLAARKSLTELRGRVHSYRGIPLVVTYHPAALLRNPNWKKPTWDDIRIARQLLDR